MSTYHLPSLRGLMGTWAYYSCIIPIKMAVDKIKFSNELKKKPVGFNELLSKTNGDKTHMLGAMLAQEEKRFINSVVVGVYGGSTIWHEFVDPSAKDKNASELFDKLSYAVRYTIGILELSGSEKMFVIHGQNTIQANVRNKRDLC